MVALSGGEGGMIYIWLAIIIFFWLAFLEKQPTRKSTGISTTKLSDRKKKKASKRQAKKKKTRKQKTKKKRFIIKTKVVGVTFKNSDGSRRQKILKKVKRGEVLNLRHQPIKGYPNAIAVSRKNGKQIGNISEELAKDVYQYISSGAKVKCKVLQVTGGTRKAPTRGCNIEINIKQ